MALTKMLKRILSALIVISAFAGFVKAQTVEYTIRGRVLFVEGGAPKASGVEVRLEQRGGMVYVNSQTTDEDGLFQFRNLYEGTFRLYINLEGYYPVEESVTMRNPAAGGRGAAPSSNLVSWQNVTLYLRRGTEDTVATRTVREGAPAKAEPLGFPAVINAEMFKKYPEKAVKEYQDGLADAAKGNQEKAADRFQKAIQLAPRFYEAFISLGLARQRQAQIQPAETAFQRAHELAPQSAEAKTRLGGIMLDKARELEQRKSPEAMKIYDAAANMLDEALKIDTDSVEAHYLIGSALFKLAEFASAESNLKAAIDAPRPNHEARLMLVNLYVKQGRYKEAVDQLDGYLAANPNTPQRKNIEQMRSQIQSSIKPQ